ncbi:hypothetical protein FNF27_01669 [Cafeteria roenbergensis]|uniref:Phosphoinositide 5-phosphatase n=3 Tax=Cafeteria roenbergensis TaxID=33653 RepID=A0A5A8EJM9_CAFRO|nr:hypothetical protein FNF27_01669 [Cafeteria roenbergensis]
MAQGFHVLAQYGVWQQVSENEDGEESFFYNTHTDESAWEQPRAWGWVQLDEPEAGDADEFPVWWRNELTGEAQFSNPAWQLCRDEDSGATFWFNSDTGTSDWDPPADVNPAEHSRPGSVANDDDQSGCADAEEPPVASPEPDADSFGGAGDAHSPAASLDVAGSGPTTVRSARASGQSVSFAASLGRMGSGDQPGGSLQVATDCGESDSAGDEASTGAGPGAARPAQPPPSPHMPPLTPATDVDAADPLTAGAADGEELDAAEQLLAAGGTDAAGRTSSPAVEAKDLLEPDQFKALRRQSKPLLSAASLGASFPLLRRCGPSDVARAAGAFRTVAFQPGDVVCVRGALATAGLGALMVVRGRLRLMGSLPRSGQSQPDSGASTPPPAGPAAGPAPGCPPWEPGPCEVVVADAGPGEVVASAAMLNPAFRYEFTVVAMPAADDDDDNEADTDGGARSVAGSSSPGGDSGEAEAPVVLLCSDALRVSAAMPHGSDWLLTRARELVSDDPMLLAVYLHQIPFLRGASRHALAAVIERAVLLRKPPHQRLILEGTLGDAFYVLLHGSVTVTIRGERIADVGAGGFFGEMSLLRDADAAPASATVTTGAEDCLLLCQTRTAFLHTLEQAPELRTSIQRHVIRRSAQQARLLRVGCLAALDDRQLRRLFGLARPVSVPPRTAIVERGTSDSAVFVVTQGTLEVSVTDDAAGRDRSLRVGAGAVVGVDALCQYMPATRRLDVSTGSTTGAQVVKFTRRDLVSAVGDDGALLAALELSILRESASLAHLARVPAARAGFLRFTPDVSPQVVDFVARCDAFARRAVALSPAPDQPIAAPPEWLVNHAVYIADTFLGGHHGGEGFAGGAPGDSPVLRLIPPALAARVANEVATVSRCGGAGLRPNAFDFCVSAVSAQLELQRSDFVTHSMFQGLLRILDKGDSGWLGGASAPAGSEGTGETGLPAAPPTPTNQATKGTGAHAARIVAGAVLVPAAHPVTELDGRASSPGDSEAAADAGSRKLRRAASRRALASGMRSVESNPFDVAQRSRLGQWLPRQATFNLERCELRLCELSPSSPTATSVRTTGPSAGRLPSSPVLAGNSSDGSQRSRSSSVGMGAETDTFALIDITRMEIHSDDPSQRQVSVWVRQGADEREVWLRFDDAESSAAFCTLAHLIEPDVEVCATGERYDHSGVSLFSVKMPTRAGVVSRVLALNHNQGTLVRARSFDTVDGGKPVPVGPATRLAPSFTDPTRVRVLPHAASQADAFDAIFPSSALRDRFLGLLRIVIEGLDVSAARVLGLQRCGWAPPTLNVWTGTFNCGESRPAKDALERVAEWLAPHRYDLYAVALQECNHKEEWARAIASVLRPANTAGASAAVFQQRGGLPFRPSTHVLVAQESLWGIHLLIFARESVAHHISEVQACTTATGIGGVMGNKGGVAIGLVYRGCTSLAFVSCHLAARMGRSLARCGDFADIVRGSRIHLSAQGSLRSQLLHEYDHVFWAGDLNFRVDMGKQGTSEEFSKVQQMIKAGELASLFAHDELTRARADGIGFGGFSEGAIDFAPTYRLLRRTNPPEYSNKKNQNASWTDRVLWRSAASKQGNVLQLFYGATFSLTPSDHRPVAAGFQLSTSMPYFHLEHVGIPSLPGRLILQPRCLGFLDAVADADQTAAIETGLDVDMASLGRPSPPPDGKHVPLSPTDELFVTFSSSLLPDVVTSGMVGLSPDYPASPDAASWPEALLPPMQPLYVDTEFLRSQHVIASLRTRAGRLVGQAELPLSVVFGASCADEDVAPKDLSLAKVLDRPGLLRTFAAHVRRERSGENIDFWLEVQDFLARINAHTRLLGSKASDGGGSPTAKTRRPSGQSGRRGSARPLEPASRPAPRQSVSMATQRTLSMAKERLARLREQAAQDLLSTRARAAQRQRANESGGVVLPAPPQGISAKAAKLLGASGGGPKPPSRGRASSFLSSASAASGGRGRTASRSFAIDAEHRRASLATCPVTDLRRSSMAALAVEVDEDGADPRGSPPGADSFSGLSVLAPIVSARTGAPAGSAAPEGAAAAGSSGAGSGAAVAASAAAGSAAAAGVASASVSAAADANARPTPEQLAAVAETARAIFDEYIDPSSAPAMVNLPAKIASVVASRVRSLAWAAGLPDARPPVTAGSRAIGGAAAGAGAAPPDPEAERARWTWERLEKLFAEASAEVFKLMATDSFARFLPAYRRRYERLASRGGGAYFGVQLLRNGVPAGFLTGQLRVLALDNVAAVADRLATVDRCVAQKRQQREMVLKSRRRLLAAAVAAGDDDASDQDDSDSDGSGAAGGGPSSRALSGLMDSSDARDLEMGSDDEEDLMARLLLTASSSVRRVAGAQSPSSPAGPGPHDDGELRASGGVAGAAAAAVEPSATDMLCVQVERALADSSGSRDAQDLRLLLKLTYQRMRSAERRARRAAKRADAAAAVSAAAAAAAAKADASSKD